jgi:hypothetical protein
MPCNRITTLLSSILVLPCDEEILIILPLSKSDISSGKILIAPPRLFHVIHRPIISSLRLATHENDVSTDGYLVVLWLYSDIDS